MSQPVALITGAASGIGLALVKHLLGKGWKVAMADVNEDAGNKLSKELGPSTLFGKVNVASYSDQARFFKQAFEWGGRRLDFFAANAGIADTQALFGREEEVDADGLLKPLDLTTMDVDLTSVIQGIWLFKFYARQNPSPGGKIVVTSSSVGLYPMPTNPVYSACKHAHIGLTRSLAPVFAKENIQINAICPAFVPTNLCPPHMLDRFPKEHLTPLSTVVRAYETFIEDAKMTGQVVELSQDQHHYRKAPEYANESQRWIGEDFASFWEQAYEERT